MSRWRLASAALGGILGALLGYTLSSGKTMLALIVVVVAVPIAYLLHRALVARAVRRGEMLFDEMHVRAAERAASGALAASIIAICLIIIVILWPTYFNIYIVPYNVVERIYPGLALSLAILSIAYLAFYTYYVRSKRVVEG